MVRFTERFTTAMVALMATVSMAWADEAPKPRFGVAVRDTSNGTGVYVVSVDADSPASRLQRAADNSPVELLPKRYAITGFNGWRIRNSAEYVEAMAYAPKQCEFEVYDFEQKQWDYLATELNGEPQPLPQVAGSDNRGPATTSPSGGVSSAEGGDAVYYQRGLFGEQRIGSAEQSGNVTTYRGGVFNQERVYAEDKGDRTEYYGPKFLWMREKYGSAEQQGDKTIYRDAWGRKAVTVADEGDRTVYRDWLGRKIATAREEKGRTVYRNGLGQKLYSADGNSDPHRDGMIGIIRATKQQQAINSMWGF